MKKKSIWLLVVAILIIIAAVIVGNRPDSDNTPDAGHSSSDSGVSEPKPSAPSTTPGAESSTGNDAQQPVRTIVRPEGARLSHVAYVHDGDTLFLQPTGTYSRDDQIKVRLIGLDTPEILPETECFGMEARNYLRSLVPKGTQVWVMPDREALDKFGRSLLYVWTMDDHSVNLDLIENGYATVLNIAPNNTYWKTFDAAEDVAYNTNAGLWGACYS